jgi:hypothetical protein
MSTLSRPQLVHPHAPPSPDDTRRHGNPNAGARHLASYVRKPRTSVPRGKLRSSVTVLHLDPARLRTARKRNGGTLSDAMLDRADVVARGVKSRKGIRAAAQAVRENQ